MSKATILIIEDNQEVRENIATILGLYGYGTLMAVNGLEGVKAATNASPDLILCDVMMPELDGFGVLSILQENERTAVIPFIFITAKTETEDIRRGMTLGADDYLTKPFYKDELLRVVQLRLKKAASRSADVMTGEQLHLSDPERGRATLEEAFSGSGRREIYEGGRIVVREGDRPRFIYRVNKGHIHLVRTHEYGRDYIIAELGEGEIFGVPCVLERTPFHYTARVASGPAECALLPTDQLLKMVHSDRSVTEALMQLLAGRVVENGHRLVNQAYDSVRRRTALVLCDLWEKYAPEPIELSREELAQMVGATKESIIRALSDFKRDGLVRTEGRNVVVLEPNALRGLLV